VKNQSQPFATNTFFTDGLETYLGRGEDYKEEVIQSFFQ
jgi:hypothetical protein